jgi:cytoskeletal protein RodZ
MKKSSLTRALFMAGAVALAGAAQADAIFHPDGRVVELGDTDVTVTDSGAVIASDATSSEPSVDTTAMGAGPAVSTTTTTTTTSAPKLVYVQPNIDWDRATARAQMSSNMHLHKRMHTANTFDVPARAGEASTMTGGAPNMVTSNERVVVGSYVIPSNMVTGSSPYYVFSW